MLILNKQIRHIDCISVLMCIDNVFVNLYLNMCSHNMYFFSWHRVFLYNISVPFLLSGIILIDL